VQRAKGDVVQHGRAKELVIRILKHEADPAPDRGIVRGNYLQPTDEQPPRRRGQQPVQVAHQRGLARAVRTDQRHALPALDRQVHPAQRIVPIRVAVRQSLDANRDRLRIPDSWRLNNS
jgi:hypothetical protein